MWDQLDGTGVEVERRALEAQLERHREQARDATVRCSEAEGELAALAHELSTRQHADGCDGVVK